MKVAQSPQVARPPLVILNIDFKNNTITNNNLNA